DVRVLDGGAPRWRLEGRPTESGEVRRSPRVFHPHFQPEMVAHYFEVLNLTRSRDRVIVDARSAERFRGEAPEPREGLRSGHIPGSLNVPVSTLTTGGMMKPSGELRALFGEAGVDLG